MPRSPEKESAADRSRCSDDDQHRNRVHGKVCRGGIERMEEIQQRGRRRGNRRTGKPARRFKDFRWTTRSSWSRQRRVVAKAEWTKDEANPRFVVTSLTRAECKARYLYEKVYCARGDMENRIKECQLDLYADRTSTATSSTLASQCHGIPHLQKNKRSLIANLPDHAKIV